MPILPANRLFLPRIHLKKLSQQASGLPGFHHGKNKCLVSSLAIRYMLRRRKIESKLSLGVIKAERGKVVAHAWLVSGETELVARSGDYTALFIF